MTRHFLSLSSHILPCRSTPCQWLLIQSLFIANDNGFQMRFHYNESDMNMWPLSWSVCCGLMCWVTLLGLSQLPFMLSISQPEHFFYELLVLLGHLSQGISGRQLQAWIWNNMLTSVCLKSVDLEVKIILLMCKLAKCVRIIKNQGGHMFPTYSLHWIVMSCE